MFFTINSRKKIDDFEGDIKKIAEIMLENIYYSQEELELYISTRNIILENSLLSNLEEMLEKDLLFGHELEDDYKLLRKQIILSLSNINN